MKQPHNQAPQPFDQSTQTLHQRNQPVKRVFLPEDDLFTRIVLRRVAWFAAGIVSLFTFPVVILRSIAVLFTSGPTKALQAFALGIGSALALTLVAGISVLFPGFGQLLVGKGVIPAQQPNGLSFRLDMLFPSKKDKKIDYQEYVGHHMSTSNVTCIYMANLDTYQKIGDDYWKDFSWNSDSIAVPMNYPSVNIDKKHYYRPGSIKEVINDSIQLIYELAEKRGWNTSQAVFQEQVAKHVSLYGFSLGGAVALQVARYFKVQHSIDIPVFADRTFSSLSRLASELLNHYCFIPNFLAEPLARLIFFAAGKWNIDNVAALKDLDGEYVQYVNLGKNYSESKPSTTLGMLNKLINPNEDNADEVILDGASLADGVDEALKKADAQSIPFKGLNTQPNAHRIISNKTTENHNRPFFYTSAFHIEDVNGKKMTPVEFYQKSLGSRRLSS